MPNQTAARPSASSLASSRSDNHPAVNSAAVLVVVIIAGALEVRTLLVHFCGFHLPVFPFPFGGAASDFLLGILLVTGGTVFLQPAARRSPAGALGLRWLGWKGPALTLLATAPCWIGLAWRHPLAKSLDPFALCMLALVFPLAEEIIFRGFGFVFTRQGLGWRVVPAALVQALIFGSLHWVNSQGSSDNTNVQILVVTTLGGVYLAAMDALGGYTLWNGFVFHASVNAAWMIFAVSDTAASGWVENALRIVSAILAIRLLRRFGKH